MRWEKKGLVYIPDGTDDWSKSHAQVPVVDCIDDDTWRIYYATRDSDNSSIISYIEVEAGNPSNILYRHNRPILKKGRLGTFDEHGLMPSCIIDQGPYKYLYYIGWSQKKSVPYQNSIGLAISSDGGKSFEKYAEGPIIGVSHIDPFFTGTMFVLPEEKLYRAYYLSCTEWVLVDNKPESKYVLKYAESTDGINWKRENHVAIPFKDEQEGGIVSASVIKKDDGYHMWFGYRRYFDFRLNPTNSYRIGYASSEDGIQWSRNDEKSGIDVSSSGWDSEMISYPYTTQHKSILYLFYNGNGFGKSGFGYATSIIKQAGIQ